MSDPDPDPSPWWRDDWKNDGLPEPWFDDDPDELSHREFNRRELLAAALRKYPTCPCSDPSCTGGNHP